jgi:hypothetical protein
MARLSAAVRFTLLAPIFEGSFEGPPLLRDDNEPTFFSNL